MSRELILWVEAKDKETNEWNLLKLYNREHKDVTDDFLYLNCARDKMIGSDDDALLSYPRGFPKDCSKEIIERFDSEDGLFTLEQYNSCATWYDWCELKALSRTPDAFEIDWFAVEEMSEDISFEDYPKVNYVSKVVERISLLLDMHGCRYSVLPGEVRVVCFLSF